jgi:8-oxo-dGTP diphosphatase
MSLYLIRTAAAVRRNQWDGRDEDRPLSTSGRAQAAAIASWLADVPVRRILSSPVERCMATVRPLAERRDVVIAPVDALAEVEDAAVLLELVQTLPEHSVLCSHNKVITAVTEIITRQGGVIDGPADFSKGSTWVLERANGRVERLSAVPAVRRQGSVPSA